MLKKTLLSIALLLTAVFANAEDMQLADPTIFFDGEKYYLTGTGDTGNGFTMYESADLVHWTKCGNANGGRALYKGDTWGEGGFWAPQIFKYNDEYYMAYVANEQIAVAKSNSPAGPFKQTEQKKLNGSTGQIDPYIFIDDDGKKYIYYVRFIGGNSLYVGEMSDDFQSIKEETITHCISAELNSWEHTADISKTRIAEGPTVIKDDGYYYLLYSANDYQSIDYAVGYAYSTSPKGPWKRAGKPFLSRHNTGINGSGHGDLVKDAQGQWYYVFHVHASNTAVHNRRTAIVPITLTDDPAQKFVPQMSRMMILNTAATPSVAIPDAPLSFEVDGVNYTVTNEARKTVEISCKDAVNFGGYEGIVTVPETVSHDGIEYSVREVGISAFYDNPGLLEVKLPESVLKIGVGAFEKSGIRSIELPSSITSVGYRSFAGCESLLDVVANKSTASNLIDGTFSATTLEKGKLWVPEGAHEKYQSKNVWKDFKRVSGVEVGTPQYDFVVDGLYYKVKSEADATCELATQTTQYATYRGPEVVVPQEVTFEDKAYKVVGLGKMVFRDCRLLEKVELPEGMESLGTYAFSEIYKVKEITLPSTVASLGSYCFRSCTGLETVTCLAQTPPTASASSVFNNDTYNGTLYVPYGKKADYAAHAVWGKFANIIELEETAIESIASTNKNDDSLYNLQGMKVSKDYKGIVISNGKKVILK